MHRFAIAWSVSFPRPARTAALALACAAAAACAGGGPAAPGGGVTEGPARTYLMGWAPIPPRPDPDLLLRTIDSMAVVSEVAIIHQPVPWPELLGGTPMESLVQERVGLADYLRRKGLRIMFLVDPLDGLDRTREDPALTAAGRSIMEPEIRALHAAWVLEIARRIRPEYMGLASEVNTLAALGDPALYATVRALINGLAPQVRAADPGVQVFVSFQADQAAGVLGRSGGIDHYALVDDFDIDALGLSSYPLFAFDDPADVPLDYFVPFDRATDLPIMMVEGGVSSEDVPWSKGDPQKQAAFFRRYEAVLDSVKASAWVMMTFTDFDVAALSPDPGRQAGLSNFASMGIMDVDLRRKPAYAEWARIFARPHR